MKRLIVIIGLLVGLAGCYVDTTSIMAGVGAGLGSPVYQNYLFESLFGDDDEDKK